MAGKNILGIDTTTIYGSVAICKADELIAEEFIGPITTHSEELALCIEKILKNAALKKTSIDCISVAIGPGSFTGLRVGLATAKAIALSLNKPLIGVSSLLALAYNACNSSAKVVPVLDARRNQIYSAVYDLSDKIKIILKEDAFDPVSFIDLLNSIDDEAVAKVIPANAGIHLNTLDPRFHGDDKQTHDNLIFVGDGLEKYGEVLKKGLKTKSAIFKSNIKFPKASNVAYLANKSFIKGEFADLSQLIPNYIRKSDAERNLLLSLRKAIDETVS